MAALPQSNQLQPFREYIIALPQPHRHPFNKLEPASPSKRTDHALPHNPQEQQDDFAQLGYKDSADDRPESEKKELWSYHDTSLLLDFYEEIFVMLGRGMVRKQDWTRMAEQLSQQSGFGKSAEQCKNRIEYLRKQYRKEKAKRVVTHIESSWGFYKRLERLVDDPSIKGLETFKLTGIPGGVDGGDCRPSEAEAQNNAHACSRAEEELTSPAHQNSHPVDALDEEETVATTKGQAVSTQETSFKPGKKRRKLVASLGKDLKEGLSEFAAVMERIETTKMELFVMLEKQRAEQEQKRAEMETERTRLLLKNQLEVARLFCGNRANVRDEENSDV